MPKGQIPGERTETIDSLVLYNCLIIYFFFSSELVKPGGHFVILDTMTTMVRRLPFEKALRVVCHLSACIFVTIENTFQYEFQFMKHFEMLHPEII